MNIPNHITREVLATLAAPDETHAVRVVLSKVTSSVPYKLRSKLRSYVFEKDRELGVHVLDVPVSVWMCGINYRARRGEGAICQDLQPSMQLPLTVLVIPWGNATPATTATAPDVFPLVRQVAQKLEAPAIMRKAIDLAAAGDVDGLRALLAGGPDKQPEPPTESPAAARMRKMREAKAAKKAQLQPA